MSLILKPQEGPQTMFMATPASICIYGGAAGGGKSFGLLLSPLRYCQELEDELEGQDNR